MRKKLIIAAVILLLPTASMLSQTDFSKVKLEIKKVEDNVYMISGMGGNIGVIKGKEGFILIDSMYRQLHSKIKEQLGTIKAGRLLYLINTHVHGDHTGGNAGFKGKCPIIAHENVYKRMIKDNPEGAPDITFKDKINIHLDDKVIKLIHMPPGHTDTDTIVLIPHAKVLHMGDLYFSGMFPYIDPGRGGNVDGYLNNIVTIIGLISDDYKIIPGHGPLSDRKTLQGYLKTLRETVIIIRDELKAGKSAEEIVTSDALKKYEKFSWRFITLERWVKIVAADYANSEKNQD